MKLSNYIILFTTIMVCMLFVVFINIDNTDKANTTNIEYANKLATACFDASKTMKVENLETIGYVWNNDEDLNETLNTFYQTLAYNLSTGGEHEMAKMALYTPVVCLIDNNGFYISHNVVFDETGVVDAFGDSKTNPNTTNDKYSSEKKYGLTSINTWTKSYGTNHEFMVRYYLNDYIDFYILPEKDASGNLIEGTNKVFSGNIIDVGRDLYSEYVDTEDFSNNKKIGNNIQVAFNSRFFSNLENFNSQNSADYSNQIKAFHEEKNELIVRTVNSQCEYYINEHNYVNNQYDQKYVFEMPEISGEDWSRLLQNPTIISFLQGRPSTADGKILNIYSLGGGELVKNYRYFIEVDPSTPSDKTYHCVEGEVKRGTGVVKKEDQVEEYEYNSEGRTKKIRIHTTVYKFNGQPIDRFYTTMRECAEQGALPCDCVYDWNQ